MEEVSELAALLVDVKLNSEDLTPSVSMMSLVTQQLKSRIEAQADVERVLGLELLPAAEDARGERWAYLIETPFMTFPKFAWGTTNGLNNDVRILGSCGAEWNALEQFNELLTREGAL